MTTTKPADTLQPVGVHCPKCHAAPGSACVEVFGPSFREVADHRVRLIAAYRMKHADSPESGWR